MKESEVISAQVETEIDLNMGQGSPKSLGNERPKSAFKTISKLRVKRQ